VLTSAARARQRGSGRAGRYQRQSEVGGDVGGARTRDVGLLQVQVGVIDQLVHAGAAACHVALEGHLQASRDPSHHVNHKGMPWCPSPTVTTGCRAKALFA
jgi:hypothetical protein